MFHQQLFLNRLMTRKQTTEDATIIQIHFTICNSLRIILPQEHHQQQIFTTHFFSFAAVKLIVTPNTTMLFTVQINYHTSYTAKVSNHHVIQEPALNRFISFRFHKSCIQINFPLYCLSFKILILWEFFFFTNLIILSCVLRSAKQKTD